MAEATQSAQLGGNGPGGRAPRRALTAAAVAAAAAFAMALAICTITTEDLGYHLAYGEQFLATGRIVDTGAFIDPAVWPNPPAYELPPGAWYDAGGAYRFPNANWLSQVAMAVVHRVAGAKGLSMLLAVLAAGIYTAGVLTMRRMGVPWLGAAAGLVLVAMVAYERFLLRPEVFGYLVLSAQLCLLASQIRGGDTWEGQSALAGRRWPAWAMPAALAALQALLVNLHSYFLLGLALTGSALADALLRWAWHRLRRGAQAAERAEAKRRSLRLSAALAAQSVACLVNPWTWRLALLPVQTLTFMRRHAIAGADYSDVGHPWSVIGEFFRPFAAGVFEQSKASYAYFVLLGLAAAAGVAAAIRRRWGAGLIIAGLAAASLSMRRNIAPAVILVTPPALAACWDLARAVARRLKLRLPPIVPAAAAAALLAVAAYGTLTVVANRFYEAERRAVRFGLGLTPTVVPVGPAEWINRHRPTGAMWADYNSSSNLMYFTRPHRDVPVLTNTWAYPPDVMQRVLDYSRGKVPFGSLEADGHWQIVVVRMDRTSIPLGRRLVRDPKWAMVFLDAIHAVFLRADGPNAALARRSAIAPETLDVAAYIRRLEEMDPVGAYSVYLGGFTLAHLGWDTQAVRIFDHVLDRYPRDPYRQRVWNMKGTCLARRGTLRMLQDPPDLGGKEDWHAAGNCFLEALRADSAYTPARLNLLEVRRQIAAEAQGIRFTYPWVPLESRLRS